MSFFPDRGAGLPIYRQLAAHLRDAVLTGALAPGTRLYASRALALQLGVSRNTVTQAVDQLISEGYLETRGSSGTFVIPGVVPAAAAAIPQKKSPHLAARVALFASTRNPETGHDAALFRPGAPDPNLFPAGPWRRVSNRWLDNARGQLATGYGDPTGLKQLREAILAHLQQTRGVTALAEQVIIVEGTRAAVALIARVLIDPGDPIAFEDPGYAAARKVFEASDARIVPVPLDRDGFDVARAPDVARLAYVTPSHQYPAGYVMGLERRLALLAWARNAGAYVIEDDYDAEFRYDGRPLPALQGLDPERVIHLGTFSKTLAPGIQTSWIVVPSALTDAMSAARSIFSSGAPAPVQAALAAFVSEGHLALHIRRSTIEYRSRRDELCSVLHGRFGNSVTIDGARTGLHLVARVDDVDDEALASHGARRGVVMVPLTRYAMAASPRGFVMGFAAAQPEPMRRAIDALAAVVDGLRLRSNA